ncbi:MAG: DUF3536 domain-containing protein [Deltaproteobacteria bacterium]|jgi:hypothetical protein|nr:DUF3536 domain-containing protein [Deltaproteobacteria bacterium]
MSRKICIHGHFYQPPREDPWLGRIFSEAGAAPRRHWNERITKESYAPLGWSRRLDGNGKIIDIINCYEWISFNAGPTLLRWMDREAPEVLARMREADSNSLKRWGHGNAMAQIYHHVIMPLASKLDKKIEIQWAMDDFEARFGRTAEGMWLSECAADTPTLEALAEAGISFVTLSPYQAKAVADRGQNFRKVGVESLDISRPYKIELPGGRDIAVFFYHGSLAQSIAFDGLLHDGDRFWERLAENAHSCCREGGILSMATDGETYGHHVKFGEMALAYVLSQAITGRDGIELTNFGAYLEAHPPSSRVILHEPSSWSCAHGVERWKADCGCATGGHEAWNQKWRAPLRAVMNQVKAGIDRHYFSAGRAAFKDAEKALLNFGKVLGRPHLAEDFALEHFAEQQNKTTAWNLLRMQESALSAFASCAWFFDDISRIEPVKALTFALHAMDLAVLTRGPDLLPETLELLASAQSNKPEEGSGARIFNNRVLPARQDEASLCLFSYLSAYCDNLLPANSSGDIAPVFPALKVRLTDMDFSGADSGVIKGSAIIGPPESVGGAKVNWIGRLPAGAFDTVFTGNAGLETQVSGKTIRSRKSRDLARHLRDFLNLRLLGRITRAGEAERILALRNCLSNLPRLEEGQMTLHREAFWLELLPYLPLACFRADGLTEETLEQAALLMRKAELAPSVKQRCSEMLDEELAALTREARVTDEELCEAVARARYVFPDMNLWKTQNRLWDDSAMLRKYAQTARAIGIIPALH